MARNDLLVDSWSIVWHVVAGDRRLSAAIAPLRTAVMVDGKPPRRREEIVSRRPLISSRDNRIGPVRRGPIGLNEGVLHQVLGRLVGRHESQQISMQRCSIPQERLCDPLFFSCRHRQTLFFLCSPPFARLGGTTIMHSHCHRGSVRTVATNMIGFFFYVAKLWFRRLPHMNHYYSSVSVFVKYRAEKTLSPLVAAAHRGLSSERSGRSYLGRSRSSRGRSGTNGDFGGIDAAQRLDHMADGSGNVSRLTRRG